jgi:hypothetical protein
MSSFLAEVAAGFAASAVTAAVAQLLQPAAKAIPKWLGVFRLSHLRTALGAVFGLTAAAGVSLSISDHTHHLLSYVLWYGLAAVALVGVIVLTIVIERTAGAASPPVAATTATAQSAFVAQANGSRGSGQVPNPAASGRIASVFWVSGVSITNLQRERKLSVNARVRYTMPDGTNCVQLERDEKGWLDPGIPRLPWQPRSRVFTCPILVDPEDSVSGDLVFAFHTSDLGWLLEEVRLDLFDQISGQGILVPRMGEEAYSAPTGRWTSDV